MQTTMEPLLSLFNDPDIWFDLHILSLGYFSVSGYESLSLFQSTCIFIKSFLIMSGMIAPLVNHVKLLA